MKFALNYSPQAADLIRFGQIPLDYYKCPDWPDLIDAASAQLPVYVHFDLKVGAGFDDSVDWATIERLATQTQTPYINHHIAPLAKHFPNVPPDVTDRAAAERIFHQIMRDAEVIAAKFGPERVIAENAPYYASDGDIMRPAALPEVINYVVEKTGCGFLLDISHARISARTLGIDERDYLSMLPVHRLRELHVTGLRLVDGHLRDHLALTDEDWAMVEWVLDRIRHGQWAAPWIVAFEYGGVGPIFEWRSDPAVIAEQVPRLYDLVHAVPVFP